ncbi:hypothetical protein BGZ52_005858, partial [Haplosporangium bisporale]
MVKTIKKVTKGKATKKKTQPKASSSSKASKPVVDLASDEDYGDVQDSLGLPRRGRPHLKRFRSRQELVKKKASGYVKKQHSRKCGRCG